MQTQRAALILIAIIALATAWAFRWEVVPLRDTSRAYMVNRWTGSVYMLQGDQREPVIDYVPGK